MKKLGSLLGLTILLVLIATYAQAVSISPITGGNQWTANGVLDLSNQVQAFEVITGNDFLFQISANITIPVTLDTMLALYDTNNTLLLVGDDASSLNPVIVSMLPNDTTYIVKLGAYSAWNGYDFTTLASFDTYKYKMVFINFSNVTPTPVPATVWLFGSGLIGLVGIKKKKIKK